MAKLWTYGSGEEKLDIEPASLNAMLEIVLAWVFQKAEPEQRLVQTTTKKGTPGKLEERGQEGEGEGGKRAS